MLSANWPGGSTFLYEMTAWPASWKSDVIICQSTHIYFTHIATKFHPSPIWNNRALGFFEDGCPNRKNKTSSDYEISSWSNSVKRSIVSIREDNGEVEISHDHESWLGTLLAPAPETAHSAFWRTSVLPSDCCCYCATMTLTTKLLR